MPVPPDLTWFKPWEFNKPDLVNTKAVVWLDAIREAFGKPIFLTDDARVFGEPLPSGASGNSLHFRGQAFDFRIRDWSSEDLWRFVTIVIEVAKALPRSEAGIELELVWSGRDKHGHIGFFFDGRPDRLLVRGD